jgi:predicted alpha/beta-fold hydrolase
MLGFSKVLLLRCTSGFGMATNFIANLAFLALCPTWLPIYLYNDAVASLSSSIGQAACLPGGFRNMLPDADVLAAEREKPRLTTAGTRAFLSRAAQTFEANSFRPHRLFHNGHAQTIAAYLWPRRFRFLSERDQERLFEVAPGVKVLAHCRWQTNASDHPTLVVWHGIEGSTSSNYMQAMAEKGFRAGFNVIRVNFRNCGGTEHLTTTIYHGGLSADLGAVVKELIEKDQISRMFLVGFSLGGNLVLKLSGEFGDHPPKEILGVCAVSPSVDLNTSAELIMKRSNWIYQQDFVRRLKKRIRTNHKLYPELYDLTGLEEVRTLREFDDRFTARAHNFAGADDYYHRSSSIRVIDEIHIPTLIIHAEDDPFIPFAPLHNPAVADNPYILLVGSKQGGHVAFIAAEQKDDEDRFWAENRVIEFCKLADEASPGSTVNPNGSAAGIHPLTSQSS